MYTMINITRISWQLLSRLGAKAVQHTISVRELNRDVDSISHFSVKRRVCPKDKEQHKNMDHYRSCA